MIDIVTDSVISLAEAAKLIPRIDGKRPHTSTLWRWCRRGIGGVCLEHIRIGHRVCTTTSALNQFVQQLAQVDRVPRHQTQLRTHPLRRTQKQRESDILRARQELQKAGIA